MFLFNDDERHASKGFVSMRREIHNCYICTFHQNEPDLYWRNSHVLANCAFFPNAFSYDESVSKNKDIVNISGVSPNCGS